MRPSNIFIVSLMFPSNTFIVPSLCCVLWWGSSFVLLLVGNQFPQCHFFKTDWHLPPVCSYPINQRLVNHKCMDYFGGSLIFRCCLSLFSIPVSCVLIAILCILQSVPWCAQFCSFHSRLFWLVGGLFYINFGVIFCIKVLLKF